MAAGVLVMAIYREKRFAITCNIALCCGCPLVFDDRMRRLRSRLSQCVD
jgi:hypothetical protein